MERADKQERFNENHCKTLIRNHPTLQNVTLEEATRSLLKFLADELPHLKYIQLINYKEQDGDDNDIPIHFTHVKTLKITKTEDAQHRLVSPANVTFDQLEEINIDLHLTTRQWLDLCVQNQNTLKVLKIRQDLSLSLLLEFEKANLSVVEMEIHLLSLNNYNEGGQWLELNSLIRLIENYRYLEKMTLHVNYYNNNFTRKIFEQLQDQLSSKWITTITEDEQFIYVERITDRL